MKKTCFEAKSNFSVLVDMKGGDLFQFGTRSPMTKNEAFAKVEEMKERAAHPGERFLADPESIRVFEGVMCIWSSKRHPDGRWSK